MRQKVKRFLKWYFNGTAEDTLFPRRITPFFWTGIALILLGFILRLVGRWLG